jgi:DNA-binding NarL/FixJ family response regulator
VDVRLNDGSGLDFLREARANGVAVPVLMIGGLRDNTLAHAAFVMDALYLVKPVDDVCVEWLVQHDPITAKAVSVDMRSRVQSAIADWSVRFGLSEAEISILLLAADGHDRPAIARIRGSSEATVKNQISALFQKTRYSCMREAVVRLLRDALRS